MCVPWLLVSKGSFADILTYVDICWHMLTHADVRHDSCVCPDCWCQKDLFGGKRVRCAACRWLLVSSQNTIPRRGLHVILYIQVYTYICISICMYECICICICICLYIHKYTHTHTHTHTHTYIVCVCVCVSQHCPSRGASSNSTHTQTHTHTQHTHTHTHILLSSQNTVCILFSYIIYVYILSPVGSLWSPRQHTWAYLRTLQHTSEYLSI